MFPLRVPALRSRHAIRQLLGTGKKCISTGIVKVQEEVEEALHAGKPVVALESAIITHGMPNPVNLETARAVEALVRENGATPATVAVLQGKLHVGLTATQLEHLSGERTDLVKISRRDFPYVLSQKLSGGTTVSATMIAAYKAGIPIFVTGGIGGVHRGAENTLDISADLTELGRTPVTVISAGIKSILDIAKTLEYLETQGVSVATFGQSSDFPAFFTSRSGHHSPYVVKDSTEAAKLILSCQKLMLNSGNLIAVPIPEEFSSSGEIIEAAIQQAVEEAKELGIQGKEVTPYILQRVNELTSGESLKANIALVKNNAVIGSQIAVQLRKLQLKEADRPMKLSPKSRDPSPRQQQNVNFKVTHYGEDNNKSVKKTGQPVVVGTVAVDYVLKLGVADFQLDGATYPGRVFQAFGGVGRNIADCLTRLGNDALLISVVGEDPQAEAFFSNCSHMDHSGIRVVPGGATPIFSVIIRNSGQHAFCIGDTELNKCITPDLISEFEEQISGSPLVCVDGNLTPEAISHLCDMCSHYNVPVCFDPADVHKATKPFLTNAGSQLKYISPNLKELRLIYRCVTGKDLPQTNSLSSSTDLQKKLNEASILCEELTAIVPVVIVTLGKDGVLLCHRLADTKHPPVSGQVPQLTHRMRAAHFPACISKGEEIVSVSGAGDCLLSGTITAILQGHDLETSVRAGLLIAMASLRSYHAIPNDISASDMTEDKIQNHTSLPSEFT